MFLKFFIPFLFYLIRVRCDHIPEPQFEVVSPNYLIAKVPPFDADLIVFRLGLQRQGQNEEVMEFGGDRTIVINSPNLNLMKGDVINYLVAFRDDKNAYSASSGTFVFDGVYKKRSIRRRWSRSRTVTTPSSRLEMSSSEETDDFNPNDSRFGGGHHGGHNRHGGRRRHHGNRPNTFGPEHFDPYDEPDFYRPQNFGPHHNFGPPYRGPPNFGPPSGRPHHGSPNFGRPHHGGGRGRDHGRLGHGMPDCRHDLCHFGGGANNEMKVTESPPPTSSTTIRETSDPDIDVRFGA